MRFAFLLTVTLLPFSTDLTAQAPPIEAAAPGPASNGPAPNGPAPNGPVANGPVANPHAATAADAKAPPAGGVEPVAGKIKLANFQDSMTTGDEAEITAESLSAELAQIEAATDLAEELKQECVTRLNKAKELLASQREWASKREAAENEIASLPKRTTEVREALAKSVEPPPPELPANVTIAQLESRLAEMRQQVESAEADASAKQQATETRATRLADMTKEMLDVEKRIADAKQQLAGLTSTDLLSTTKKTEQRVRLRAREEQLTALKVQRRLLEATSELMPLERDLAVRTASANKKQLQRWQEAVSTWRKQESKRQAEQARRIAEQSHPALRSLAVQNADIAELRITTAAGIERIDKMLKSVNESSELIEDQFEDLRSKVEHAGATSSTGILLRKQRSDLPEPSTFTDRAVIVDDQMPKAHLRLMELKQWRREVADPEEAAEQVMKSVEESLAEYDSNQVRAVVMRLLSDRRDLLDKTIPDQDTYLQDLNELDLANQSFEQQVDEFRQYLDQRVLWMRSNDMLNLSDVRRATSGMKTLLAPARWGEVVRVGGWDLLRRPATAMAVLAMFLLVIMFRARMVAKQKRLCEPPPQDQPANFLHYAWAFAITFIISARYPALLMAVGYRLIYARGTTPWTSSVGEACLTTVVFVWGCEMMREMSRRDGIAEKLFGWSAEVTASIRGMLELTLTIGTPLFAILQLSQFGDSSDLESLQRLLFITILLISGFQIGWLARPDGKLMRTMMVESPTRLLWRLRRPIWIFSSAAPLAFAVLSLIGYHFSAYQLSGRLAETGAAIVAMIVLYSLSLCWLRVSGYNRTLSVEASREVSETIHMDSSVASEDVRVESQQTTKATIHEAASREFQDLLQYAAVIALVCGGWFIWSDVMPALRILDRVELWQNIETVAETVVGKDGSESISIHDITVPTTLTDVLTAILICIGTVMVSRRLPGLFDLILLDRLPMDQGGRQAISILVRYAATVAGLLFACQVIRLSWSSVQWLAAAMTVGLGFGLQEIFANLVSGLIILFERPIRAGDMVTVGDVTGHVTRMQMRATTITDFDRRELIVPNKRFITDNVINWTLSDPISRVVLPVGVAYGTDVQQAQNILMRIARQSSFVMSEPAPNTLFKGFGDSTLDMELRVFIPTREVYVDVVNQINSAINREFSKANIEIAFPQRDLHIKSVDSISGLLFRPNEEEKQQDQQAA